MHTTQKHYLWGALLYFWLRRQTSWSCVCLHVIMERAVSQSARLGISASVSFILVCLCDAVCYTYRRQRPSAVTGHFCPSHSKTPSWQDASPRKLPVCYCALFTRCDVTRAPPPSPPPRHTDDWTSLSRGRRYWFGFERSPVQISTPRPAILTHALCCTSRKVVGSGHQIC